MVPDGSRGHLGRHLRAVNGNSPLIRCGVEQVFHDVHFKEPLGVVWTGHIEAYLLIRLAELEGGDGGVADEANRVCHVVPDHIEPCGRWIHERIGVVVVSKNLVWGVADRIAARLILIWATLHIHAGVVAPVVSARGVPVIPSGVGLGIPEMHLFSVVQEIVVVNNGVVAVVVY